MTSSTKPEAHKVLHCRQRTTEPRSQVTFTENFVKFEHVVFEIREWTVRPTDRLQSSHPPVGLSTCNTVLIENWVAGTVTLQNSSTLSLKPIASSAKTEFKTDVVETKP